MLYCIICSKNNKIIKLNMLDPLIIKKNKEITGTMICSGCKRMYRIYGGVYG